jgi:prepilin-type processing-associated H-X9-DG protein
MERLFRHQHGSNVQFCDGVQWQYFLNDVSSVINMNTMFYGSTAFNGDISEWDVSSVTNMSYMFFGAQRSMAIFPNGCLLSQCDGMFLATTAFNGDISEWDVLPSPI